MGTPDIHFRTLFILNDDGRILSTREPGATRGPLFSLVRNATSCTWGVRSDLPDALAHELDRLAGEEPTTANLREAPVHADRYVTLVGAYVGVDPATLVKVHHSAGPAFTFPEVLPHPTDVMVVDDEQGLHPHFRGWIPGEITAGRSPVLAIVEEGSPVSICFCARRSDTAAEAGLETAAAFRGRGLGPRVAAAWALAIRGTGRVPLYSTDWHNAASLSVAHKLGLVAYASSWSLSE